MGNYRFKNPPIVVAVQWDGSNWTEMHDTFGEFVILHDDSNPDSLQVEFDNNMLIPRQWLVRDPITANLTKVENGDFTATYEAT